MQLFVLAQHGRPIDFKMSTIIMLCEAMGGAEKVAVPWGNHSLSNRVQETIHYTDKPR